MVIVCIFHFPFSSEIMLFDFYLILIFLMYLPLWWGGALILKYLQISYSSNITTDRSILFVLISERNTLSLTCFSITVKLSLLFEYIMYFVLQILITKHFHTLEIEQSSACSRLRRKIGRLDTLVAPARVWFRLLLCLPCEKFATNSTSRSST